ncbi:MAG: LysR family transcriptional regulator [Micromonosporaceae bacterium]|nr:LysR family transcriptional regulator [Micromonosporaceae bacterium]
MNGSVDMRRLHVLRMVAQHGTVTAAATAVHLTPSAVSHQLRQLAHEVGVALLEPNGRRVRLTAAGESLVAYADTLHADWERARGELAAHAADGGAGVLRMCGYPTVIAALLAPAAKALAETHPRLTVRITEAESDGGFDLLLAGEADIAIVVPGGETPPLDDPKFDQRPLLEEPLDLFVPADHPLAGKPDVELIDAAHEPWIIPAPGSSDCAQLVSTACTAAGFSPRIVHQAKDVLAVAALVASGLGVALEPRLAPAPSHCQVARIPLRHPAPSRHILTCVRRGSEQQPAIALGLAALRELSRDLPPPLLPEAPALDPGHDHEAAPHRHARLLGPDPVPAGR